MNKRTNPMAIKAALTDEVSEAALALGKSPATTRNWIRDALPVTPDCKPPLISGEILREYDSDNEEFLGASLKAVKAEAKTILGSLL
jgi:hypothetical protein